MLLTTKIVGRSGLQVIKSVHDALRVRSAFRCVALDQPVAVAWMKTFVLKASTVDAELEELLYRIRIPVNGTTKAEADRRWAQSNNVRELTDREHRKLSVALQRHFKSRKTLRGKRWRLHDPTLLFSVSYTREYNTHELQANSVFGRIHLWVETAFHRLKQFAIKGKLIALQCWLTSLNEQPNKWLSLIHI